MKKLLITLLALVVVAVPVLNEIKIANLKIENERMQKAKVMCTSGSDWVKLKGELNTRSCKTLKRI